MDSVANIDEMNLKYNYLLDNPFYKILISKSSGVYSSFICANYNTENSVDNKIITTSDVEKLDCELLIQIQKFNVPAFTIDNQAIFIQGLNCELDNALITSDVAKELFEGSENGVILFNNTEYPWEISRNNETLVSQFVNSKPISNSMLERGTV